VKATGHLFEVVTQSSNSARGATALGLVPPLRRSFWRVATVRRSQLTTINTLVTSQNLGFVLGFVLH
ncbi:MAG: hypothetical protein ACRD3O_23650, partial [Terriglobia bacterium]